MKYEQELEDICRRQPLGKYYGDLYTEKGEYIRKATKAEWEESKSQALTYGGRGVFSAHLRQPDGWWIQTLCYVLGGPRTFFEMDE